MDFSKYSFKGKFIDIILNFNYYYDNLEFFKSFKTLFLVMSKKYIIYLINSLFEYADIDFIIYFLHIIKDNKFINLYLKFFNDYFNLKIFYLYFYI